MSKRRYPILEIAILLVLLIFCVADKSFAQENKGGGITISPLTFELTSNPGDVLANKLKVYNSSDAVISVKMEVEDFKPIGESGEVVVAPDEETTYSLKRWVATEPGEFTLEPKEQKFVDFIISVPQNAEPGGKYGTILVTITGSVSADKISGAAVAQKIGALVLLTVSGDVKEGLIVKDFSAPSFLEYGPVPFSTRFENIGSVHVRPRGFISITDWRGEKAVDIEFTQSNVIPGTIREIDSKWNTKWLFGKYTATLVGSYGTSNTPFDPYVITFWVLPWKLTLIVLTVLLIFFVFFFKTRKRWKLAMKALVKGNVD